MKKIICFALAAAMMLTLAATSFANTGIYEANKIYEFGPVSVAETFDQDTIDKLEDSFSVKENKKYADDTPVPTPIAENKTTYGATLKITLKDTGGKKLYDKNWRTEQIDAYAQAYENLNVKAEWDEGGEYVDSVKIDKGDIAIKFKKNSYEPKDVSGTVYLTGKTMKVEDVNGKAVKTKYDIDTSFDVSVELVWEESTWVETVTNEFTEANSVNSSSLILYDMTDVTDEELIVDFVADDETWAEATINADKEKKIPMSFSIEADDKIDEAYPDAYLDFYKFEATFRRTAEVRIYNNTRSDNPYIYEIVEKELVPFEAEYDEFDESFVFKTKKLGSYVISEIELNLPEKEAAPTAPENPSTGAAA